MAKLDSDSPLSLSHSSPFPWRKTGLRGIPSSCCPSITSWAKTPKTIELQRKEPHSIMQEPFLQQGLKHNLISSHWIYPATLAEKGKEREGGEKTLKFWFLKWENWCGSHRWWINMGQRIVIWQPALLTDLRGIWCYLVWFRENIFWAAISHLRGFTVL